MFSQPTNSIAAVEIRAIPAIGEVPDPLGLLASAGRWIDARRRRFFARRKMVREFFALQTLPDHLLRDVGLHRGVVNAANLPVFLGEVRD